MPTIAPAPAPAPSPARHPESRTLAIAALAAAAGFAVVSTFVARRDADLIDRRLRRRLVRPRGHPARDTAEALTPLGKWKVYLPVALAVGAALAATRPASGGPRGPRRTPRQRYAGAAAIVLASAAATGAGPVFDRVLRQPPAPPGHRSPRDPVYPSGHAMGATAFAGTAAYVLAREGIAPALAAWPAAAALWLGAAGGKLVEDRHWPSDVLGGTLAGAGIAAAVLAAYERVRDGGAPA